MIKRIFLFGALMALFAGCQSYEILQHNIFSDDDGNVVRIGYGRSDAKHKNTFRNPANGKIMDYESNLVVEVDLPDGDSITAWMCMNMLPSGSMYKTDNEKWMVHVTGFTATVYLRVPDREDLYQEVYRGILCETPKSDYEPNPKWRQLKKDAHGRWK